MEHHYSLTGRMLAIFVGGLIVLSILLFAAGLLAGREWGAADAIERLSAAKRSPTGPAPSAAPVPAPAAVPAAAPSAATTLGTGAAEGAIRPAVALPQLPVAPALPKAHALPAPPKLPSLPAVPTLPLSVKSSQVNPPRDVEPVRRSREVVAAVATRAPPEKSEKALSKSGVDARSASGRESDAAIQGFVVYVGAFESGAKAESIAKTLQGRNLTAQTSLVEKSGRKPLVTVWVGPFDTREGAEAVLPEIRAAGLDETMIREVP